MFRKIDCDMCDDGKQRTKCQFIASARHAHRHIVVPVGA